MRPQTLARAGASQHHGLSPYLVGDPVWQIKAPTAFLRLWKSKRRYFVAWGTMQKLNLDCTHEKPIVAPPFGAMPGSAKPGLDSLGHFRTI